MTGRICFGRLFATAWAVAFASVHAAQAATLIKSDTPTMNAAADWGGAAPTIDDVGTFGSAVSAANDAGMRLGGNVSIGGLVFDGSLAGPVNIGSAGGYTLTLGAGGIDLSAATQAVAIHSAIVWSAGPVIGINTGGYLTLGSSLDGASGSITGSGVLTVNQAANTVFDGSVQDAASLARAGGETQTLKLTSASGTTGTVAVIGGNLTYKERGNINDLGGGLAFTNSGSLLNAGRIIIRNSTLTIDNTGTTNMANRINDVSPITLDNGTIRFKGQAASNSTESLGAVTVSGYAALNVISGNNQTYQAALTLGRLVRNSGAMIQFDRAGALGGSGNVPHIFLADSNDLTFVNGTLVGMVSYDDNDKYYPVSYVSGLGFGRKGQTGFPNNYYNGSLGFADKNTLTNAAATTDFITNASQEVMPGGQTVNSFGIQGGGRTDNFNGVAPVTFKAPEDTLVIASGWLAAWFGRNVIGSPTMRGAITSGHGELFLFGGYLSALGNTDNRDWIHSVIKDRDMEHAVKFVINCARGIYLTANNAYTGGTVINGILARENGNRAPSMVYLNGDAGAIVIPNAAVPGEGLSLNNGKVTMVTNPGQIGSGNVVTLSGGSELTLTGNNTLSSLVFCSNGGTDTPTVTPGGALTVTGDIVSVPENVAVIPTIGAGALDLNGDPAHTISVAVLPAAPLQAGLRIAAVIQNGGLRKTGAGVLELTGTNTYRGATTVDAGTLALATKCLNDGADVRLARGAKLRLDFSGTDAIRSLYFGDVIQEGGTYGASGSGANHVNDAFFSGGGTLTVLVGPKTGVLLFVR